MAEYEPGPIRKHGKRPFSHEKYRAALTQALAVRSEKEVSERVGVSYDVVRQWNRQERYRETVEQERRIFAKYVLDKLYDLYKSLIDDFQEDLDKWKSADDGSGSPNPQRIDLSKLERFPVQVQDAIAQEAMKRLDFLNPDDDFVIYTAINEDLDNLSHSPKVALQFLSTFAKAHLEPIIQDNELSLEKRKNLQMLQEFIDIANRRFQTSDER